MRKNSFRGRLLPVKITGYDCLHRECGLEEKDLGQVPHGAEPSSVLRGLGGQLLGLPESRYFICVMETVFLLDVVLIN